MFQLQETETASLERFASLAKQPGLILARYVDRLDVKGASRE